MLYGMDYLRNKLASKRSRVLLRYSYYDMKKIDIDPGPAIPSHLKWAYQSVLGWTGLAVDAIADRLSFNEFTNDMFKLNEIYQMNNPDTLFDSAILDALIGSCSFVYISPDEEGFPQMQVIDAANATGVVDPITGMLKEGYAVIERDKNYSPIREAYFIPGKTEYYDNGKRTRVDTFQAKYAMLVPVIYKPNSTRPFGHSRVSRAVMSLQAKACSTLTRADITAEFYSFPQKYVLGLSPDAEPLDSWKATMSAMLQFDKDEDGGHPVVGQFNSASMNPHLEQFKLYASAFAGETGLTLDDLGFPTANPSSVEAIKASHDKLNRTARKAQKNFSTGFLNAGYLAACLRDGVDYNRREFVGTAARWEPMFEADASSLGSVGDAINKIQQAFPNYFNEDKLHDLTGM